MNASNVDQGFRAIQYRPYTRNVLECSCGVVFELGQGAYGLQVGELLVRHTVGVHHREPTRLERTPRKPTGKQVSA